MTAPEAFGRYRHPVYRRCLQPFETRRAAFVPLRPWRIVLSLYDLGSHLYPVLSEHLGVPSTFAPPNFRRDVLIPRKRRSGSIPLVV